MMNGYCISDRYCQYKSDTGYCGYTAGCILDNSITIKVPTSQKWVSTQVVDISTDSIEAIADAVVKKRKGDDELPSAQPEQRWIPCSERLPEVGQDVLFSVRDMYSAEGCLRDDGNWCQFRWGSVQLKDHVTAWMPLPEPYGGEKE